MRHGLPMDGFVAKTQQFAEVYLLPFGIRLVLALVIFWIGRLIARQLARSFDRMMETSKLDVSLRKFLHDIVYAVMLVAVIIAGLDVLGVETTAVIAVLGAAGLAVGLALQGSLSNLAAGVMLIVLRPYKVGDLVSIGKYVGRVEAIKVFHTLVVTEDHREITIPNGQIITNPIENLTVLGRRRIDLIVNVTDGADVGRVRQVLDAALADDARLEAVPRPTIEVAAIGDTSVKLYVRPWVSADKYEALAAETMHRLRDALANAGMRFTITPTRAS